MTRHFWIPLMLLTIHLSAFGCVTNMNQQVPIDTANLLPKELAKGYLQTVWGETQPNEEGMLLDKAGIFNQGVVTFYRYDRLNVTCLQTENGFLVWVKHKPASWGGYIDHNKRLYVGENREKMIKICTALVSLGAEFFSP